MRSCHNENWFAQMAGVFWLMTRGFLFRLGFTAVLSLCAVESQGQTKKAETVQANSPEQHFRSAQTFQIAGDYEKAAAEYREAVARGLEQLGNLRTAHQDYAKGIKLLEQAVQVAPNLADGRIDLGIAKFRVS